MATKTTKTSTVKSKANEKTTAPKVARVRKSESTVGSMMRTPAFEEIAARAYERYVARGCEDGHDVEDWLDAERDLQHAH
jgi:hypothetical protein